MRGNPAQDATNNLMGAGMSAGSERAMFDVKRAPYRFARMDRAVSNKPSETNVGWMPVYFLQKRAPAQVHSTQTPRLISRYAALPVGKRFLARFGAS